MLKSTARVLRGISDIGVEASGLSETLHLTITNIAAALGILITAYYLAFYALMDAAVFSPIILANLIFFIPYPVVLLLNSVQRYSFASVLFFCNAFAQIGADSWLMGRDSGIALFLLGVAAFSLIAFPDTQRLRKALVIIGATVMLLVSHFVFIEPAIGTYPLWIADTLFALSAVSTVAGVVVTVAIYAYRLKLTKSKLEIAMKHMPGGMFMTDRNSEIVLGNDTFARMFELPPQLVAPGAPLGGLIDHLAAQGSYSGMTSDQFAGTADQFFADGKEHRFEWPIGSDRTLDIHIAPIPEGGAVAVAVDISQRKLAEIRLREATYEAERANRAKSDFLASMSHDLRTPLNAILGFAQLVLFDPKNALAPKQAEHLEHIIGGGNHLLDLINQILDLAGIEAGEVSFSIEDIDARDFVTECLDLVAPLAASKGISVVNRFSSDHPTLLRTDPLRLKQILINILSNAVKYNRDGGNVVLEAVPKGQNRLRLSVSDTGIGISETDQAGMFMMFHRLDADASHAKEGSGIGLYVSRLLVERLDGAIGFESKEGVGSTFWFELPLAEGQSGVPTAETA